MNKDILKGNWKKMKGRIKESWGKLTDDELDQIEGNYDRLVGKIQEKYGYKKDESERKVDEMLAQAEGR